MSFLEILFIGIALSIDTFIAAISISGANKLTLSKILIVAFSFGFFQALMPLIGYLSGSLAFDFIKDYDHWVVFILLSLIGGHMIYTALFNKDDDEKIFAKNLNFTVLILISIATSIDALAVGASFFCLGVNIFYAIAIIGICTFTISFFAAFLGNKLCSLLKFKPEIFGGLILIGIGVKILIEHLSSY